MRNLIVLTVMLAVVEPVLAQNKPQPPPRFGVPAETDIFPQDSPKQTLASIAKAFDRKRLDYMLAHLLDPAFGNAKVAQYYRQKFGKAPEDDLELPEAERDARAKAALALFVAEVNDHLATEPKQTLRFFRLLKEGNVEEAGTTAKVTLKDAPSVVLTLKQIDGRWYIVNDIEGDKPKGEPDKPKK